MAANPKRCRAVEAYTAKAEGELTIKEGDVIYVPNIEKQTGNMLTGVSCGKAGKFPRHVIEDTTVHHTHGEATAVLSIHEYEATCDKELSFPLGAKMFVVHKVDDNWWNGVYSGKAGLIPASHIQAATAKKIVSKEARADVLGEMASMMPRGAADSMLSSQSSEDTHADSNDPKSPVWDWGKLPKARAERELQGHPNGTFLVRASESTANAYTISVVAGGAVSHIRLISHHNGFAISKTDQALPTIGDVIEEKQGRSMTLRTAGSKASDGKALSANLLSKPLPRPAWAPTPCCWNAKPVDGKSASGPQQRRQQAIPKKSAVSVSSSAAIPTSAPTFKMSGQERKIYSGLWSRISKNGNPVPAPAAGKFFQTSGIDRVLLGHIWNYADVEQPQGQLTQPEFNVALKLMSLAQSGQQVSISNLDVATKVPQLAGHTEAVIKFLQAEARPQAPVLAPKAAPSVPAVPTTGDEWVVSAADFSTYQGFFKGVDSDNDGLVGGNEVMGIFLSSQLDKAILGQIWNLVDTKKNGMLNVEQFALAMWIISQKVKGVNVPQTLSPAMVPPSLRSSGGGDAPVAGPVATVPVVATSEPAPQTAVPPVTAPPAEPEVSDVFKILSPHEIDVYEKLWAAAAGAETYLGPQQAVGFMMTSGLETPVLGQIWDVADEEEPKGQLIKREFFIALKLIALHQAGKGPSLANINEKTDLPQLQPHTASALSELVPVTEKQHEPEPRPEPEPVVPLGTELNIDAAQQVVYDALWERAAGSSSALGPGQAVGFLQSSGLDNQVLGEIWDLADQADPKGQLSKDEFFVALKLIAVRQANSAAVLSIECITETTTLPRLVPHTEQLEVELAPGETTAQVAQRLWTLAAGALDTEQMIDGGSLRPLLQKSELDNMMLGNIWSLADSEGRGRLNFDEFQLLCGLIGQAQRGEAVNIDTATSDLPAANFGM